MADKTPIEWTDATWNPITGCSVVSPGCTNCYAMKLAGTRLKHIPSRAGLTRGTKAGPVWTGEVRFNEQWLDQPLRWRRPRMIFVCAHGDLFAPGVLVPWLDRIFAVMALADWHVLQVLTKRPEIARAYLTDPMTPARIAMAMAKITAKGSITEMARGREIVLRMQEGGGWPLPNVWLGISAEDQRRADERVPLLLATPAAVRWVSAEPLIGPIDFGFERGWCRACNKLTDGTIDGHCMDPSSPCFAGETTVDAMLHWIVAGGESGHGARPMHPDWVRAIRDQCAAADVAFLFKQHGAWAPLQPGEGDWPTDLGNFIRLDPNGDRTDAGWPMQRVGKKAAGRLLDGVTHDGFPGGEEVPFS